MRQQFFEVLLAVVRDANGFRVSGLQQLLHVLPRVHMRHTRVEIARAVRMFWKERMIAVRVHSRGQQGNLYARNYGGILIGTGQ